MASPTFDGLFASRNTRSSHGKSSNAVPFDIVVLTAANETQARGYRAQMAAREREGMLPPQTHWLVVPDLDGRRIGSGTSTLLALQQIARLTGGNSWHEAFDRKRILIAHSGGDARRIPAYAAQGKIFLPMPCDFVPSHFAASSGASSQGDFREADQVSVPKRPASLFDLILESLSKLPASPEGEVIVCSGDVLLTFDASSTRLYIPGGVGGIGFTASPTVGKSHGVYLTTNHAMGGVVTNFLQKPSLDEMKSSGAIDATGQVLVDTGVLMFAPRATCALLESAGMPAPSAAPHGLFAGAVDGRVSQIDLYREIVFALTSGISRDQFEREVAGFNREAAPLALLNEFRKALRARHVPFGVTVVPNGEFFHVGTSRDLMNRFSVPSRTAWLYNFRSDYRVFTPTGEDEVHDDEVQEDETGPDQDSMYLNVMGQVPASSGPVFLENCDFTQQTPNLSRENVVVGWAGGPNIQLPPGLGLVVVPVQTPEGVQDVPALFGLDDDNKTPLSRDGLWLNRPLKQWLEKGFDLHSFWFGHEEKSSWTIKIWQPGEEGWKIVRALCEPLEEFSLLSPPTKSAFSWADLLNSVSHEELLRRRTSLSASYNAYSLFDDVVGDTNFPVALRIRDFLTPQHHDFEWRPRFQSRLETHLSRFDIAPLERARLLRAAAVVEESDSKADRARVDRLKSASFVQIAQTLENSIELVHEPRPAGIQHDQAVWATAPARIDFAGGWSDTPPICLERGGTVLNAAVTLNKQFPIQVVAKLNDEGCIRLTSIDLGKQEIYRNAEEINGAADLQHWSSLAKAALVVQGIVPERGQKGTLGEWLGILGGGLDLTLFSGLPKGSGMGTSSILGAAILACLARVLGQELTHAHLISQTSLLEQRLTSGGGWQDQVGGIVPGVKLIRTSPGLEQVHSIQWSIFGPNGAASDGLQRRMLLYYSGQKRLAANILQHVVGRYLAREPEALRAVAQLKDGAEAAKVALETNDFAAFSACVDQYWQLKKSLDPGSTNEYIEGILQSVKKYTSSQLLCGAGGGGFMLFIARDAEAADRIRVKLSDNPPHQHARFFDFAIDSHGLTVTVL